MYNPVEGQMDRLIPECLYNNFLLNPMFVRILGDANLAIYLSYVCKYDYDCIEHDNYGDDGYYDINVKYIEKETGLSEERQHVIKKLLMFARFISVKNGKIKVLYENINFAYMDENNNILEY